MADIQQAEGLQLRIRDVEVGQRVMGTNGQWRKITEIKPFGRGQKLISLDGEIDGTYSDDFIATVKAR